MHEKISNRLPDKNDADNRDRVLRWFRPGGLWNFCHYKLVEPGDTWMRTPDEIVPVRDDFFVNRYTNPSGCVIISSYQYSTREVAESASTRRDFETIRLRRVLDGDPEDMDRLLGAIHDLQRELCENPDAVSTKMARKIGAVVEASHPGEP